MMKTSKLIFLISLFLFSTLLLQFCKSDENLRNKKRAIEESYIQRNLEFSERLIGKRFALEELNACSTNNELKFIMIYRNLDCSTCLENCRDELVSKGNISNIAVLKLGFSEKEDSSLFLGFGEVLFDECDNILNAYGYFPTPSIFKIENDKIVDCHFYY